MELKLEIKFASKEELVSVAKALSNLHDVDTDEVETSDSGDEYEEVESPFKPQSLVPEAPVKENALTKKETQALKAKEKADLKAAKEKQDAELKETQRLAVEAEKKRILESASQAAPQAPQHTAPANQASNVYEEIKALGDKLLGIQGMPIQDKQAIINSCIARVNGPQGVAPSTYPLELAIPFKQFLEQEVNALFSNPPMQGLV